MHGHQESHPRRRRGRHGPVRSDRRVQAPELSLRRRLENVDLSSIRSIYNGAEPISVALCNEFMNALAYTGLKRHAMFPVYGLAEACLAVAFPPVETDYRWIRINRHRLTVGTQIEVNPQEARDTLEVMCVGHVVPNTELLIADAAGAG